MTGRRPEPGSEPVVQDELMDALVQTSFVVMGVLNKVGARHDLSLTQLRVLAILRDRRLQMTAIADYLGLEKSTMSGLVERAERRGLLTRVPNLNDRRAVEVVLTPNGRELTERLYVETAASLAPVTHALSSADRRRLPALLRQLRSAPLT